MGGRRVENDDLVHGAMLLACVCLKTWNEDKGTFSTYYFKAAGNPGRYLNRSIFREYTKSNQYRQVFSIDIPYGGDHTKETVSDAVPGEDNIEDEVMQRDESKRLASAIARLPDDLQSHALDILNDSVDWSDVENIVKVHNRTLEALRREMS
jgi:DNA-directed RNA polymerase specialized sigma24 family protein